MESPSHGRTPFPVVLTFYTPRCGIKTRRWAPPHACTRVCVCAMQFPSQEQPVPPPLPWHSCSITTKTPFVHSLGGALSHSPFPCLVLRVWLCGAGFLAQHDALIFAHTVVCVRPSLLWLVPPHSVDGPGVWALAYLKTFLVSSSCCHTRSCCERSHPGSVWAEVFLSVGPVPRRGTAEARGKCTLSFLENWRTFPSAPITVQLASKHPHACQPLPPSPYVVLAALIYTQWPLTVASKMLKDF